MAARSPSNVPRIVTTNEAPTPPPVFGSHNRLQHHLWSYTAHTQRREPNRNEHSQFSSTNASATNPDPTTVSVDELCLRFAVRPPVVQAIATTQPAVLRMQQVSIKLPEPALDPDTHRMPSPVVQSTVPPDRLDRPGFPKPRRGQRARHAAKPVALFLGRQPSVSHDRERPPHPESFTPPPRIVRRDIVDSRSFSFRLERDEEEEAAGKIHCGIGLDMDTGVLLGAAPGTSASYAIPSALRNDQLVAIDGIKIQRSPSHLIRKLLYRMPSERIWLTLWRDAQSMMFETTFLVQGHSIPYSAAKGPTAQERVSSHGLLPDVDAALDESSSQTHVQSQQSLPSSAFDSERSGIDSPMFRRELSPTHSVALQNASMGASLHY